VLVRVQAKARALQLHRDKSIGDDGAQEPAGAVRL